MNITHKTSTGGIENEWADFSRTGSVQAYLRYKALEQEGPQKQARYRPL